MEPEYRERQAVNTSLALAELERDMDRHGGIVTDLGDPDLEASFEAYRESVRDVRRWLVENHRDELGI